MTKKAKRNKRKTLTRQKRTRQKMKELRTNQEKTAVKRKVSENDFILGDPGADSGGEGRSNCLIIG